MLYKYTIVPETEKNDIFEYGLSYFIFHFSRFDIKHRSSSKKKLNADYSLNENTFSPERSEENPLSMLIEKKLS